MRGGGATVYQYIYIEFLFGGNELKMMVLS